MKIKEPVGISADNDQALSDEDAESDDESFVLPEEVKFEILSGSEPEDSSKENLSGEEPKSKRLCKMIPTSHNDMPPEIKIEIKELTTDSNLIENEVSSAEIVSNLINNAVVIENIFKHLSLTDLLNFRTVSTDWDKKIISHLDKDNRLRYSSFERRNIEEFISLMKSSKSIPFTKFKLTNRLLVKGNIQNLLLICGSSIKHFSIRVSDFTEKLRRLVPNLESLHLDGSENKLNRADEADDFDDDIISPVVFSKLTDMKYNIKTNDVRTLFKSTPNLTRLEIRNPRGVLETSIVTDLLNAGRLGNITKLHLNTLGKSSFQTLLKAASTTGLFLEEFCVNAIDKKIDLDDLNEFLSSENKSLKMLEILSTFKPPKPGSRSRKSRKNSQNLHNFDLKKMIALTSLSVCIEPNGFFPRTKNALEDLPNLVEVTIPRISSLVAQPLSLQFSCSTVTKLVVGLTAERDSKCKDEQNVLKFLGILFPSVKYLKLCDAMPQYVEFLTTVWPALKHLEIGFDRRYNREGLMDIKNANDIHSYFPCLVQLKDLETLSIFKWSWESKSTQCVFIRLNKAN